MLDGSVKKQYTVFPAVQKPLNYKTLNTYYLYFYIQRCGGHLAPRGASRASGFRSGIFLNGVGLEPRASIKLNSQSSIQKKDRL